MKHIVTVRSIRRNGVGYPPFEKGNWLISGENTSEIIGRAIAAARRDGYEHITVTHIDGQTIAGKGLKP